MTCDGASQAAAFVRIRSAFGTRWAPVTFLAFPKDGAGHDCGGIGLVTGQNVRMVRQREGDGGVTNTGADDVGRDTFGGEQGHVCVSQVVEADAEEFRLAHQSVERIRQLHARNPWSGAILRPFPGARQLRSAAH